MAPRRQWQLQVRLYTGIPAPDLSCAPLCEVICRPAHIAVQTLCRMTEYILHANASRELALCV